MARPKYALTPYLRRRLKKPIGHLFTPEELNRTQFREAVAAAPLIVTVGDRVTDTIQALGRTPDIQVVDGRERRKARVAPGAPFSKLIRVGNPAGVLTRHAVAAARRSFREAKRPVRILVDGEEDLLTIPILAYAPEGSVIYYGQPGVGVVMLRVDDAGKQRARRLLERMSSGTKHQ